MKLHSRLGITALFFSAILMSNIANAFAEDEVQTTETKRSSRWSTGAIKGYLSTIGTVKEENIKIPVLMGVEVKNLWDSWGDARSNGRTHEGIDIMAPRGTPVVSPTNAVVSKIGYGANGGNYVYTINGGGERYYFAHLDSYAPGLTEGKKLVPGDLIGYVGNTGNASGGAPHLHFGIYDRGASNPYPRLTIAFSDEERVSALNRIVANGVDTTSTAKTLASTYKNFLKSAQAKGLSVGDTLLQAIGGGIANSVSAVVPTALASSKSVTTTLSRDLTLGSTGEDVRALQKFLNTHGAIIAQTGAGSPGNETVYFGPATRLALMNYQAKKGINPTSGYFGPLTRATVSKDASSIVAMN